MTDVPSLTQARALSLEELHVGDWVAFDVRLAEEEVDGFAAMTGDRSPIHVSDEYARSAGFPGRVVHGMLAAAHLSTVVGMLLPGRKAMLMAQKVDFIEPVPVGATVTITARVHQVSPGANAVTLSFTWLWQGLVTARGSATVRVRGQA